MAVLPTDITGPRPLTSIESTRAVTPLGDTRQDTLDRLTRLEVGKQFQAQILSRYNDGTFLVRIADTAARLALPAGGKVGDGLALTLLSTEPRPTFSLDGQTAAESANLTPGARIARSLYLSNAEAQAALATPAAEGGAATAELSSTGKLIDRLLTAAQEQGIEPTLLGKLPIASAAGAGAPQLASALQDTLAFSGLFYESHLQQWAAGERPLADLLREPQAQAGKGAQTAAAAASAAASQVPGLDNAPPEVREARRNLLDYFSAAPLPAENKTAALDPATAQMVNLQLNTLEQQRVQWQGELWPGQPMRWEVSRDEQSGQGASGDPDQQQWQSVVRFSLPSLGEVSATVRLAGQRVQIQVRTTSEESAATLRRFGPQLAGALGAAGSVLDGLTIKRED